MTSPAPCEHNEEIRLPGGVSGNFGGVVLV